jgi:hypothetical protein
MGARVKDTIYGHYMEIVVEIRFRERCKKIETDECSF